MMRDKPSSLAKAWVGLIILTVASTSIAEAERHVVVAVIAIFAIAAVKADLVLTSFMEAARAERQWIWLYRLWIGLVATMLIVGNLV